MMRIRLTAEFGLSRGIMGLSIRDNDGGAYPTPQFHPGVNYIELEVNAPKTLIFTVIGKHTRDTVVDPNTGKIVRDKYINITNVEVDGKPLKPETVMDLFLCKTWHHGESKSAFWAFEGNVEFEIPYSDPLDWHLASLA